MKSQFLLPLILLSACQEHKMAPTKTSIYLEDIKVHGGTFSIGQHMSKERVVNELLSLKNGEFIEYVSYHVYRVKKNDSLWSIGKKFYGAENKPDLIELLNTENPFIKNNKIQVGALLKIPKKQKLTTQLK